MSNQTPPRKPKRPPWLLVWTSTPHGVARVKSGPRGEKDLHRILRDLCEHAQTSPPQRTMAGGWIVSLPIVGDLRAYARVHGEWVLVREQKTS